VLELEVVKIEVQQTRFGLVGGVGVTLVNLVFAVNGVVVLLRESRWADGLAGLVATSWMMTVVAVLALAAKLRRWNRFVYLSMSFVSTVWAVVMCCLWMGVTLTQAAK